MVTTPIDREQLFGWVQKRPLSPANERSLNLFADTLERLFEGDSKTRVERGVLFCDDTYKGHEITWILNVESSIIRSLKGDFHLSLAVSGVPDGMERRVKDVCVLSDGELPVGDTLTSWLLLYQSGLATTQIHTMRGGAEWVCGLVESISPRHYQQMMTNAWAEYYVNLIEQYQSDIDRFNALMDLDLHLRIFVIRQLLNLDTDTTEFFSSDNRDAMVTILLDNCECNQTLRSIIAWVGGTGDWEYLHPLLKLRRQEPEDECVIRALEYAIGRLQSDFATT